LYEKVVLYAIHFSRQPRIPPVDWRVMQEWVPTHMARQLPDGTWTSKCGGNEDIRHLTLDALESYGPWWIHEEYGCPVVYMKRRLVIARLVRILQQMGWKYGWF
jgi:hypothetical protein